MAKKRRTKIDPAQLKGMKESKQAEYEKDEKNSELDFIKCLSRFADELEIQNKSIHTIDWYKRNLKAIYRILVQLHLNTDPAKITEEDLKQVIAYLKRDKKEAPTTINHRIKSLKQFFKVINKQGLIDNFPTGNIEKLKVTKSVIKPLSDDQLRKLFEQPDKSTFVGFRDYTFMLVLLDTGVRLLELANMKLEDVKLKENKIIVLGKGNKEREVIYLKTTAEHLRRYINIRGDLHHNYLWINQDDKPMHRRNFEARLSIYGERARITNVRVSPHTFRHTCAKRYITRGGDSISLQKLLGHTSLDMVSHYVYLWGTDLKRMHEKFSPVEDLFDI